ncbi:hypothetical protein [Xylophilus sp. GOD-11R]|uniref:hypothetical protein n=1 Tax=Xylophilus sp. GOD-11R TaxID=3089814 RepID=UPI00298CFE7F|nr:hypothetical protein [Xylophilus sp. GOD-11R]WPB58318.1 hypothetical protein R9X41_06650 [Xylophilus sp. GOD-11R]
MEESEDRHYHWVLSERRHGEVWQELDRSSKSFATFHEAMAAGLVALEQLVDDLDLGPRSRPAAKAGTRGRDSASPDEDAGHDTGSARQGADERKSLFGFGPVR